MDSPLTRAVSSAKRSQKASLVDVTMSHYFARMDNLHA